MKVFKKTHEISQFIAEQKSLGKSIGFVPTMGALHEGHLSLLAASKQSCDISIVSIFINPTQFNDTKDFEHYPVMQEEDLKKLEVAGNNAVFLPSVDEMYQIGTNERWKLDLGVLDQVMEGAHRPGHFDGVVTIVKKLFEAVNADCAFFGEKDYQQLMVIRLLAKTSFQNIKIIGIPTHREKNGLAMSSRNLLLSKNAKTEAALIYKTLIEVRSTFKSGNIDMAKLLFKSAFEKDPKFSLEYAEIRSEIDLSEITDSNSKSRPRAFIAAKIEGIRLIDNLPLF